jgi:release factor glutamine methyltransferase
VTVLEVIQRSTEYLAQKGVDSPRLQIELLLAHVLRLPRLNLYLNFDRVLAANELDTVRQMVKRRGQREPLQQIVGSTSFCGLELAITAAVLVPRPETELLAERAWNFLLARQAGARSQGAAEGGGQPSTFSVQPSTLNPQPSTVLDFGTGSGCLAIAVAAKCPGALVYAVDISPEALAVAATNAARHGMAERIRFLCGDGFSSVPAGVRFDLIVANPPYIPSNQIASLQPEVRDFDPRLALDGGPDGLAVVRRLAADAPPFLRPGGRLMLEFGDGQAEAVCALCRAHGWQVEGVEPDYGGRSRFLIAQPA